eukprot:gnl/MRDRNA2_/MRDRNA2_70754_c0_seq2.p1 gnl/MRDRNA2_/MRDRNA2_70754_c0~~gnl/MRDRNA2_/MRDRNA2_70754_c0_seq2.p1  ORF type:complete len:624 (-),score=136.87 gnl/MRDRNA2_/MRDRNA2_70754_c0_seq2:184-2055(-)
MLLMESLVDKLVSQFLQVALKVTALHHAALNNMMLGKQRPVEKFNSAYFQYKMHALEKMNDFLGIEDFWGFDLPLGKKKNILAKRAREKGRKTEKVEAASATGMKEKDDDDPPVNTKKKKLGKNARLKAKIEKMEADKEDEEDVKPLLRETWKGVRVRVIGSAKKEDIRPLYRFSRMPLEWMKEFMLNQKGFADPTAIQAYCWPIAFAGRDLIGIAETGSGKTLAYLLPAFPGLLKAKEDNKIALEKDGPVPGVQRHGPYVLVLAPTRELAIQIADEAADLKKKVQVTLTCVYGGTDKGVLIGALAKNPDILVATPGRLWDFLKQKHHQTGESLACITAVTYIVLDEADMMLDMGFKPQINAILKFIPQKCQTLLFSATWPKATRTLAESVLHDPMQVRVGVSEKLDVKFQGNQDVHQRVLLLKSIGKGYDGKFAIEPETKWREFWKILQDHHDERIMIFCGMKKSVTAMVQELSQRSVSAIGIHGDMDQYQRANALQLFRQGDKKKVLVATDVAARGLDVHGVAAVVNYDPPEEIEDHVHRIGRTGRAGHLGLAYTLLACNDIRSARIVAEVMRSSNQTVPSELEELADREDPRDQKAKALTCKQKRIKFANTRREEKARRR